MVHTYPEICENANFFLRIRFASTRIQRIFRPYPEIFENALQSGNMASCCRNLGSSAPFTANFRDDHLTMFTGSICRWVVFARNKVIQIPESRQFLALRDPESRTRIEVI